MTLKPPEIPHLAGRDEALRALGFRDYEAQWLALVCLHSGVFTRTQFTDHHHSSTKTAHAFVGRLVDAGLAREHPLPGVDTKLRYTHVHNRRLYRALDIEHLRHRRNPKENVVLFRRLLSFDHVVRHPDLPWLATEQEKVAHFTGPDIRLRHLPSRAYGGAAKSTRRYFALKLPIAADDKSATFVYVDPGRHTDRELRRWANEHRPLWARLQAVRTKVHVAVIARTVEAQHDYAHKLAAWCAATSPPVQPLTPAERELMTEVEEAITTVNRALLPRWGGLNPARALYFRLRERAESEAAGEHSSRCIDAYSTHHTRHLGPQSLALSRRDKP